jgi:large subunit ribosomal protein L4
MPKKAVKGALRSAVSLRANDGKLKVFEAIDLPDHKCKGLIKILEKNSITSALIVGDDTNRNLALASRNLRDVKFIEAVALNVYDVLRYEELVMTKAALTVVQAKVGA